MNTKKEKRPSIVLPIIKNIFKGLGTTLATLLMVGVITGCIVGSVLTVYVLQTLSAEEDMDLSQFNLGYTSKIYEMDSETGEYVEVQQLYKSESNRIPVVYANISPYVKQAMIAIEDKRFEEHNGVDWRRSAAALLSWFGLSDTRGGGSTIHQQLIKNVTGDDAVRVDRKVREIFRAINLFKSATRDEVLEAYLNVVSFGAGTNGIESAANTYFGKTAKDLTLAESASIVGITQYPGKWNPFVNPDLNKDRQLYVLSEMLEQERITQEEHDKAVTEKLNFKKQQHLEKLSTPQSWFNDHVIREVLDDLIEKNGYSRSEASADLYEGGYHIYSTVDQKIQAHLEEFYLTTEKFPGVNRKTYPQSSALVMNPHNGEILGLVGGRGEKKDALTFNRATQAKRQPGSTFKPIGPYTLAFDYDRITWSMIIDDSPLNPEADPSAYYPRNYYGRYLGPVPVTQAITRSINTVAMKVGELVTPQSIFNFLHDDLHMDSLVEERDGFTDVALAPMALGGTTDGVTGLELTAAYQIFSNGGIYNPPHAYSKVLDSEKRVVLEPYTTPRRVIQADTAVLMTKLLEQVVINPAGTGQAAKIPNMPTAGKTGTSDNDVDQWFVGFTPYYVAEVWLGYDRPTTYNEQGQSIPNSVYYSPYYPYPTPYLFHDVMAPIHEGLDPIPFPESENVVSKNYCTVSGDLQGSNCGAISTGWYKTSRIPNICSIDHAVIAAAKEEGAKVNINEGASTAEGTPAPPEKTTGGTSSGTTGTTSGTAGGSTGGSSGGSAGTSAGESDSGLTSIEDLLKKKAQ